jgi:Flp pilus assembly secretin CpaC
MKHCIILLIALFGLGVATAEENTLKEGAKAVGQKTVEVAKKVGTEGKQLGKVVANTSVKVGHKVAETAVEVGHAVRDGTQQAVTTVKGKVSSPSSSSASSTPPHQHKSN